ncbi:MAG: C4-type zinc ribbon domain-containing protein [Acidobacteriota bacterium]|nr:C4-type zinc ribbon domain-containing protein [Acidobacteriota bacterium]
MKEELAQLIALQKTDISIRRLEAELKAIPQRRAEIEKEFEQRAFEFRAVEAKRDEARATRLRLEREIEETRHKAEHAERALMSSKNEKEYSAAIREADAARKHISQLETQTLEQMETLDSADKQLTELEPEIGNLRAELEEKLNAFAEQTQQQAERIEQTRAERERLLAELPKPMGALYSRISTRIRDGIAVAEARNSSCTACFMTLRPQVMSEIRRGEEIIICDNCNRILYYVPAEQPMV